VNENFIAAPTLTPVEREVYNQAYIDALEFYEPVILNKSVEQPRVFVNMIPRTAYTLGSGLVRRQDMFYGDIGPQGGLVGWSNIQKSRPAVGEDPGYNSCKQYDAELVEHGFEERYFTGYQRNRRTYDLCINDMKWTARFMEQIGLVYGNLADVTLAEWDNLAREAYIKDARKLVMAGGTFDGTTFTYDPFTSTRITMPNGIQVSALQWDFMRQCHVWLSLQARPSATGMFSGQPAWTMVIDPTDFDDMLHADPVLMTSYNYYRPQVLLDNYGTVDYFKGFTLNYDMNMPRFTTVDRTSTTTVIERVPQRIYQDAKVGYKHTVNSAYMNAEYGLGIIYLKDTIELQVPPAGPASPGGGTKFGVIPNLMGQFSWLNIITPKENPFGEIGHYFARMQSFIRPLRWSQESIVFLYKRRIKNPIILTSPGGTPGTGAITGVSSEAVVNLTAGETAELYSRVKVVLANELPCEAPALVTVGYTDNGAQTVTATIGPDANAPTYTLVFETPGAWATLLGTSFTVTCQ
jgi:hypothetical protein